MDRRLFRPFRFGAAAAVASGAAALAHELLWTRRLVDLLGASSEATARVLGCFFLGLALGSALSTRLVRRIRRPWRAMAVLESAIAVATLPALFLPWWTDWIWPSLGPERLVAWQGGLVKLAVSVVVVLPPAVLMGMTLPVLAEAALDGDERLGREGVWLYALNTVGGVVGLLLTASWTLPAAGAAGAMAITLGVNLGVAALCLFVDSGLETRREGRGAERQEAQRSRAGDGWLLPAMGLSFASGAGVLALEVLAIHQLRSVVYSSLPAATALLVTVILVLAIAAGLVPRMTARFGSPSAILPTVLILAAELTVVAPFWFVVWTDRLAPLPTAETSTGYLLRVVWTSLVTLGPAILVAGLVLPLTFAWCDERAGRSANRKWGWLLAANGLGGLLGAEGANAILMPTLGMHGSIGAVAALYAAVGGIAWVVGRKRERWSGRTATVGAGAALALGVAMFALDRLPQVNARIAPDVRELITGRDGVTAVSENPGAGLCIVVNNQYLLGASKGEHVERRQMLLPLLLHEDPRTVAHIGHATGITPGGALSHPGVRSLVSVEISRPVTTLAARHFGAFNRGIEGDPRATVVVEDGRTYLASATGRFDVIVGDLYRPFGAGEGRLFSVEHFRAARRALRAGGLFCQWLPMFQLSEPELEVVLASFLRAFPEAHLVRGNLVADLPLLGLIGLRGGSIDWSGLPERCARLRAAGDVADGSVRHPEGVRMLYLGRVERGFAADTRINTLDNAWIEIHAGNLVLTRAGAEANLRGTKWLDFEQRLFRRLDEASGSGADEWARSGRRITALQHLRAASRATPAGSEATSAGDEATSTGREATLDRIDREIAELLPAAMREDPGAHPDAFPRQ